MKTVSLIEFINIFLDIIPAYIFDRETVTIFELAGIFSGNLLILLLRHLIRTEIKIINTHPVHRFFIETHVVKKLVKTIPLSLKVPDSARFL